VGVPRAPTVPEVPISAKSLPPRQQERVRAALQELVALRKNQEELADELDVRQQTVSRALKAGGTIGVKLAYAVARARGQTFDDLVGGVPAVRTYAELAGWADAAKEAVEHGEAPSAVAAVARWPASLRVARVQWLMVADLAMLWRHWAPPEEREEEETADATREEDVASGSASDIKETARRRGRSRS
jgi:transcriptional regulator with XRE-family HTH domain